MSIDAVSVDAFSDAAVEAEAGLDYPPPPLGLDVGQTFPRLMLDGYVAAKAPRRRIDMKASVSACTPFDASKLPAPGVVCTTADVHAYVAACFDPATMTTDECAKWAAGGEFGVTSCGACIARWSDKDGLPDAICMQQCYDEACSIALCDDTSYRFEQGLHVSAVRMVLSRRRWQLDGRDRRLKRASTAVLRARRKRTNRSRVRSTRM